MTFHEFYAKKLILLKSLQKVKTTIKTLISNCEYLENYEQHNRLLEAQRGGGGEGLPCPFWKIGKKCPNLEKKCPDYGHL